MALVIEKPVKAFDLSQIGRGCLLWGRHCTWDAGRAGFVTSATETQLVVQYHPGIGNITNHFIIHVQEAVEGQWEIRWSADLAVVHGYNTVPGNSQQEPGFGEGASGNDT